MRYTRTIERGLELPALAFALLACLGMITIVALIVASVVLRKFFDTPLFFTEELVGILMSVSLFLALPMVTLRAGHIRVSLVEDFLHRRNPAFARALGVLATLSAIAFCGWMLIEAVPWLEFAIKRNLKTETARILLYPGMLALPAAMLWMMLIVIARQFGLFADDADKEFHPEA